MYVHPFNNRHKDAEACYVVEGEFYAAFASARGPLYPFPPHIAAAELAAAQKAESPRVVEKVVDSGSALAAPAVVPVGTGDTPAVVGDSEPSVGSETPSEGSEAAGMEATPPEVVIPTPEVIDDSKRLARNAAARAKRKTAKRSKK